jgi:hypothetical protein
MGLDRVLNESIIVIMMNKGKIKKMIYTTPCSRSAGLRW